MRFPIKFPNPQFREGGACGLIGPAPPSLGFPVLWLGYSMPWLGYSMPWLGYSMPRLSCWGRLVSAVAVGHFGFLRAVHLLLRFGSIHQAAA